jgi:hypothetical protein
LSEIPDFRQSGEESFCLDLSCFVLCIKAKNEVGFGVKPRQSSIPGVFSFSSLSVVTESKKKLTVELQSETKN